MDSLKMNRQLGTKWFTFYTKVRPWFACLTAITVIADFAQYADVYMSYWWMMIYFIGAMVQPVLCIMVFAKSQGDYEKFVGFVNGVLIFETINMAYGQAVQQYIQNEFNIGVALVVSVIILLLGYFIWYRLNIKYFRKRILVATNDVPNFYAVPNVNTISTVAVNVESDNDKVLFCRKCGEKLIDGSRFCRKCGTEIVD